MDGRRGHPLGYATRHCCPRRQLRRAICSSGANLSINNQINAGVIRTDAVKNAPVGKVPNGRSSVDGGACIVGKVLLLPDELFRRRSGAEVATQNRTQLQTARHHHPRAPSALQILISAMAGGALCSVLARPAETKRTIAHIFGRHLPAGRGWRRRRSELSRGCRCAPRGRRRSQAQPASPARWSARFGHVGPKGYTGLPASLTTSLLARAEPKGRRDVPWS